MSRGDALFGTERLLAFPFTKDMAEHIAAGDPADQGWSAGYPRPDDKDVARMFLKSGAQGDLRYRPQLLVLRETGEAVGGIGFFGPPDAEGTAELGYGVAPEVEGRGLATEALTGLLEFGFNAELMRRVKADTTHDNIGSQRVMEKAGMHRTGSDDKLVYYAIEAPQLP